MSNKSLREAAQQAPVSHCCDCGEPCQPSAKLCRVCLGSRRTQPPADRQCVCGESSTPGVVHRKDGPCYMAEQAPELSDEQIFELAAPFGEFRYGDAQGDKRIAFARAVIAADRATRWGGKLS